MSFLSVLGNIFGIGGGGSANYANIAGQVAAGIESARGKGRADETSAIQSQDRTAVQRYQAEQQAKINAALLAEKAAEDRADRVTTDAATRAKQVGLGDLLANMQPATLSGMPSYIPKMTISGGLNPSALGPMTRAAGTNLAQQALAAQMSGSDIPAMPNMTGLGTDAPTLTPTPQAGKLDTLLTTVGAIGLGAKGIGEVQDAKKKAQQAQAEQEAANARNNPQEIPNTTAGGYGGGPAGAVTPNVIQQLLRMKQLQQQQQQDQAD
jgi:hypothetical protein